MEYLICPKCKKDLQKVNNSLVCVNRHCYDISSSGYVNLLIHKSSQNPGDNQEMVKARSLAMANGYYDKLLQSLAEIISSKKPSVVLDLACGEGSLTSRLSSSDFQTIGIDISKSAINSASKKDKLTKYIVASISEIPLKSQCVDLVLNCFAPLYTEETKRILKKGGYIIKVTPFEKHLLELKQAIYPEVYLNTQKEIKGDFQEIEKRIVRDRVLLQGEYLESVIKMTPYFYKTPKYLLEKVKEQVIDCSLEFCITIMRY